jgi:flagellar motor switch protein FliN/FliY
MQANENVSEKHQMEDTAGTLGAVQQGDAAAAWKPLQPPAPKPTVPVTGMNLIMDVPVQLSVELGRVKMPLREVMELREGSVIALNKSAGEPVSLYINEQLMARGEIVLVEDFLGIRITETVGELK